MQCQRLSCHLDRLFIRRSSSHRARKIRERDTKIRALILMHDSDVVPHGLPQLQTGLLLNALQRADRNVGVRMRHCHKASLPRMLKLKVAALLPNLLPTRTLQCRNHLPTAHSDRPSAVYSIHARGPTLGLEELCEAITQALAGASLNSTTPSYVPLRRPPPIR